MLREIRSLFTLVAFVSSCSSFEPTSDEFRIGFYSITIPVSSARTDRLSERGAFVKAIDRPIDSWSDQEAPLINSRRIPRDKYPFFFFFLSRITRNLLFPALERKSGKFNRQERRRSNCGKLSGIAQCDFGARNEERGEWRRSIEGRDTVERWIVTSTCPLLER